MRGAEAAVQARLASLPIRAVTIDLCRDTYREAGVLPGRGRVFVEPEDTPARLDLRVCYGLDVHLHANGDTTRALEVFERVREFKPRSVVMDLGSSIVIWNPKDGTKEYA